MIFEPRAIEAEEQQPVHPCSASVTNRATEENGSAGGGVEDLGFI